MSGVKIEPEALERLPVADARMLGVAPLRTEGPILYVATSRPDDLELEQTLSLLCRSQIEFTGSPAEAIDALLTKSGDSRTLLEGVREEFSLALVRETEQGSSEAIDLDAFGKDAAPVVRLVNETIRAALQKQASDIHIHSDAAGVSVDFRTDGVLTRALGPFDPAYQPTIVSRIKVMADLDIAEHRIPQDGRFRLRGRQGDIDFRVSVLPGVHGEDIVIRVLDKTHLMEKSRALTLEALGYEDKDRETLARIARASAGMLLVTGPTGSGKTTTLYACLSEFSSREEKVITIEDPVEYELPGVLQVPVADKKGLTFARGLRSILRHDPDRIMVGEIRDRETASIAVQAALTGHFVFTTVHANNAIDVISRFTHMEIDLHELVAALSCVVAQRLLRRLCGCCSAPRAYAQRELAALGLNETSIASGAWCEAKGCDECDGMGYAGRTVAAEVLILTPELKQMIVERRATEDMRASGGVAKRVPGNAASGAGESGPRLDFASRSRAGDVMRVMSRASCLVEIGAAHVFGAWRPQASPRAAEREAKVSFGDDPSHTMRSALDEVLDAIVPGRRVTSPFVQVSLEGQRILSGIKRFTVLPKSPSDRRLVISQRFCRDHRLEADAFDVMGWPLAGGESIKKILCLAVEKKTLKTIREALAAKGLHADVIAPAYLMRLEQHKESLERPGVAVFDDHHGTSIAVWDEAGALIHLASIEALEPYDAGASGRMLNRLTRYALVAAEGSDTPATIYAEQSIAGLLSGAVLPERGLRLLQWPGAPRASGARAS
nr:GspE/PulE family protein [Rhodomicrobium udaipurense]